VDIILVEYSQISLLKICSIHFSAEDINICINSQVSDLTTEPARGAGASAPKVHEACGSTIFAQPASMSAGSCHRQSLSAIGSGQASE
jgi:hypothetical protein